MRKRTLRTLALAAVTAIAVSPTLVFAQTASQDMKNAGSNTKSATKNAGSSIRNQEGLSQSRWESEYQVIGNTVGPTVARVVRSRFRGAKCLAQSGTGHQQRGAELRPRASVIHNVNSPRLSQFKGTPPPLHSGQTSIAAPPTSATQ